MSVKQGTVTTRASTHDAAGNVVQDLRGANVYNYAVNNAGRIKWVTGAGTASYLYDGFQKLRYKSQGGAVTNYVWDAFGHIIAETSGAFTREYIWLGDTPLAVNEGATLSYVHPDHLDRPVAMTTSGGPAIAWQAKYDPFGNVVTITNPTVMTARFPGQWFQIEDGLSYNWHRNYDPTLGRYSQADPLGFVDGPGVYNYAGGSPVMNVDPMGQSHDWLNDWRRTWGFPAYNPPQPAPMCTQPNDKPIRMPEIWPPIPPNTGCSCRCRVEIQLILRVTDLQKILTKLVQARQLRHAKSPGITRVRVIPITHQLYAVNEKDTLAVVSDIDLIMRPTANRMI